MPTDANKKAAMKAKVRLTKTVNGKRVKKSREELSKNIQNVSKAKNPMPTMAEKEMAKKVKVRLTKIVNGKRVKKSREELLKNVQNKKGVPVASQPRKVVKKDAPVARQPEKMSLRQKRYIAFLNRYKYENYPYIGDDLSQYAENYAGNKTATLENYKIALKNAENEARRNYGN